VAVVEGVRVKLAKQVVEITTASVARVLCLHVVGVADGGGGKHAGEVRGVDVCVAHRAVQRRGGSLRRRRLEVIAGSHRDIGDRVVQPRLE